jgi:hypothetical protein
MKKKIITAIFAILISLVAILVLNEYTTLFIPRLNTDRFVLGDEKYNELGDLQNKYSDLVIEDERLYFYASYFEGAKRSIYENAYIVIEISDDHSIDLEEYKKYLYKTVGKKVDIEFIEVPIPAEPLISGFITRNTYDEDSLLVVSDTVFFKDGSPDAIRFTMDEQTQIIDSNNLEIDETELEYGMKVEVYTRGMVLTTYPGMAHAELIIVIEH